MNDKPLNDQVNDLCAEVLSLRARITELEAAGTFAQGVEAAAKVVNEESTYGGEHAHIEARIRALAPPKEKP